MSAGIHAVVPVNEFLTFGNRGIVYHYFTMMNFITTAFYIFSGVF